MSRTCEVITTRVLCNKGVQDAYVLYIGAEAIISEITKGNNRTVYLSALFSSKCSDVLEVRLSTMSVLKPIVFRDSDIEVIEDVCISDVDSVTAYKSKYKPQLDILFKLIKDELVKLGCYKRGWKTSWCGK